MAKLKDSKNTFPPEGVNPPVAEPENIPGKEDQPAEPAPAEAPPKKGKSAPEDTPAYVDRILRVFPAYRELYIDIHGGAFAPGTPQAVRGDAPLYPNPYHKP